MIVETNSGSSEYYFRKNIFGDIVGVYDPTKGLLATYTYDAFGNSVVEYTNTSNNKAYLNPFRYRGYYWDEEIELYYLQSRYYDPEIGRFISPDSIEYINPSEIFGLNLYAYCNNNPIMNVDPTGCFAISTFLISMGIGALVGWALSEIFGSQVAGGVGSVVGGGAAISTGIGLMAFGPWGIALGIVLIIIGAATAVFGTNEIVDGFTGTNYIQNWTGMSDGLYNGLYVGLNIASTVGAIVGNFAMKYVSTSRLNAVVKEPAIIQSYSKFQFETYARYSNEWFFGPSNNGKGMKALSLVNRGNSIRYGYGINNAKHYYNAYYWVVASNGKKYRFPFI